jgi:imidazolonepropionase-like amidohydrolase
MLPWMLVLAACSSPAANQNRAAANGVTMFEGARLIIGDRSAPIEQSAFIIENNKFTGVGKRGELKVPSGATRVDLTGKTVMPAMVDIHSHLGFLKQSDGSMSKANFNRENILDHLNRYAYHGFAAVISSGTDMGELPYQLREEVHPEAALFRTVGRGLAWPGSGPFDPARNDVPYAVTTEAEARAAVRDLAPHHPDFVKIWVDDRNGRQKKLTPPLYTAAADEAHKQNLRAIAHVFDLDDAKGLVRAGVVGFMHMVRDADIDEELIALLKQHPGVFFGPNIGITSRGLDAGRPEWLDAPLLHETIPPSQIQKLEQSFTNRKPEVLARTREDWERAKRNIARLRANGVTLALGSDSAGDPSRTLGWHAIWEVESLAKAGIPPMEVITMSTKTAAEILRLDRLGMVATGKSADFIVLDASPLDDMANIRKISGVYLRGQAVDRAGMRARWKAEWTAHAGTISGGGGH